MVLGKIELVAGVSILELLVCKTLMHLVGIMTSFFLVNYHVGS